MFDADVLARETRPVGVLLGGTGLVRNASRHMPRIAALMRPWSSASQAIAVDEICASGGQRC